MSHALRNNIPYTQENRGICYQRGRVLSQEHVATEKYGALAPSLIRSCVRMFQSFWRTVAARAAQVAA
jgi:hypothetical protein